MPDGVHHGHFRVLRAVHRTRRAESSKSTCRRAMPAQGSIIAGWSTWGTPAGCRARTFRCCRRSRRRCSLSCSTIALGIPVDPQLLQQALLMTQTPGVNSGVIGVGGVGSNGRAFQRRLGRLPHQPRRHLNPIVDGAHSDGQQNPQRRDRRRVVPKQHAGCRGDGGGVIRLWDAETAKEKTLASHRSWIIAATASPDGRMLAFYDGKSSDCGTAEGRMASYPSRPRGGQPLLFARREDACHCRWHRYGLTLGREYPKAVASDRTG